VLSLFISGLLPIQADLRIALTVSDPSHAQIHTNLGALAGEVGLQLLQDISLVLSADAVVVLDGLLINTILMLSSQSHLASHLLEHRCRHVADRTFSGSGLALSNITADSANPFLHCVKPPIKYLKICLEFLLRCNQE
jgi:hypothetical protein